MASTNTSTGSSCVAAAVTSLEAAAYDLLKAFNAASSHTQHVILNDFVSASDLHGMSLTVGAATLVQALDAMSATTTTAYGHGPDRCLSAAAGDFDKAAVAVIHAISSTDPATQHAIYLSYQECDLPHLDQLDPLFAIAALAQAIKSLTHTDALGLTIDLWGGHQSRSPEHLQYDVATTEENSTEMATGNKAGPHLAYYESVQGLPLIVGPFPDYNTAWRHIDGPNVDEDLYDRAWVQPITAPDAGALYPRAKLPGQCHASGCDLPGTTHTEREKAETMLCDECAEHLD